MHKQHTILDVIEALKRDVPVLEAHVEAAESELSKAKDALAAKSITLATLMQFLPADARLALPAAPAAKKKPAPRRKAAPRRAPKPQPKAARRPALSAGRASIQVLMEAGRPMHGLKELLPRLLAMGVKTGKSTLPSALARVRVIEKTAPGTYAYVAPQPKVPPVEAARPETPPAAPAHH